ncbi:ACT domain-containing protein [Flavobacterium degerlachei]|jgi:hypothetical protein|uniref:Uncharacterized protein n=1 Tax=Flavobacterium degerlachei TaxID=229203 RepID=A0A1H2TW18_9FLAO|nr:ACT domain-containing protein [Flavobacterium degerlachei]SDW47980.1 hypothetical protein SAMN05444338_10322 [Flavobacterium degerlachei]
MAAEENLEILLKTMKPQHNIGEYVFCVIPNLKDINLEEVILVFREKEGITIVIKKELADSLKLDYSFISGWITLTVHSSLQAVGLTAAFSNALAKNGISCNVIAAFYHDHIFVDHNDINKAIHILEEFSN